MIRRSYSCDLCGATFADADLDKKLRAIYWGSNGLEVKPCCQAEHHLCNQCMIDIADLYRRLNASKIAPVSLFA